MIGLTRIQALEKQNKDLRIRLENREEKAHLREKDSVIAMLQKEIGRLTQKLEEAGDLQMETMRERIDAAVAAATAPLLEELGKAHLEIARLKAIINKDSSNSSKPPRTNEFKEPQNSREPSGRTAGGQKGHPGHRLGLPENMDELVEKGVVRKQVIDHTGGADAYISRYVIDVEVVTTVTEHRYAIDAKLPENLYNEVGYGENIRAMSVLLLTEGIIAEKRLSEMMEGLTQGVVTLSPATLEKFQSQFAQKLKSLAELDAIKEDLLNGEVMHTDDTPMRSSQTVEYLDNGEQIRHEAKNTSYSLTIRTHSNDYSTFYTVNPRKDMAGVERDGILPRFIGIVSHDHESKFYNYGLYHATCGEHLCRDLKGLLDLHSIPWAGLMRDHMLTINKHKNEDLKKNITACDQEVLQGFENEYDDLIERGWAELAQMQELAQMAEPTQQQVNDLRCDKFRAMLNRLTAYKDCYLLFIRDYKAPFTNNLAERDLRFLKTKQNVSGLFRSWDGILNYMNIRSFISTLKKRKMNLFSAITKVSNELPVLRRVAAHFQSNSSADSDSSVDNDSSAA